MRFIACGHVHLLDRWPVTRQALAQGSEYHQSKEEIDIYPDFVMMAKSFGVPSKRIMRPAELKPAIQ